MPVTVEFPGGDLRPVPSRKRQVTGRRSDRAPDVFVEQPLPDPFWQFECDAAGKWTAKPK